jgi:hypothetical protein
MAALAFLMWFTYGNEVGEAGGAARVWLSETAL